MTMTTFRMNLLFLRNLKFILSTVLILILLGVISYGLAWLWDWTYYDAPYKTPMNYYDL